jgi:hypothetical protein
MDIFSEAFFLVICFRYRESVWPAALANCPPIPIVISMSCMAVPRSISVGVHYADKFYISYNKVKYCTSENLVIFFQIKLIFLVFFNDIKNKILKNIILIYFK